MMTNRTRLLVIVALIALCAVALVAAFAQCGGQPSPAAETPGMTAVPTTPGATAPTVLPETAMAEPGTTVYTPEPTPTLTREEEIGKELAESGGQFTASAGNCGKILETEDWCSVVEDVVRITRPEWGELSPETEFFVVKRVVHGGEYPQQHNMLVIEQDGQHYTAETFDRLLEANGITEITDENRELVARALVLMTLPDYLEEEITFSELVEGDWPAPLGFRYNYALTVWTKMQGLSIGYHFLFDQGRLRMIRGIVGARNTGDYIDVSLEELPGPSKDSMTHSYWGR